MLELQALTRRFGATTAVDGVSLAVPAGQMLGIIGRSGAGKSTLLRMINRLIDPTQGSIFFDQTEVSALAGSALRRWQRRIWLRERGEDDPAFPVVPPPDPKQRDA